MFSFWSSYFSSFSLLLLLFLVLLVFDQCSKAALWFWVGRGGVGLVLSASLGLVREFLRLVQTHQLPSISLLTFLVCSATGNVIGPSLVGAAHSRAAACFGGHLCRVVIAREEKLGQKHWLCLKLHYVKTTPITLP